jgi:non-ribosomal peptide synthetase-like protein
VDDSVANPAVALADIGTPAEAVAVSSPRPRYLHQFFEQSAAQNPDSVALLCGSESFTYTQLERHANRMAHYLAARGAGPGTRVGILLRRSPEMYAALLAIGKTGAAYVPIDPSCPFDRVAFIARDAELCLIVSTSGLLPTRNNLPCPAVALDEVKAQVGAMPGTRPQLSSEEDSLAYIIYTSGTTGRPKGVAIRHSNICHYLDVIAPIYYVTPADRVYQGMTIAFDFSIEEIWVPFHAGAAIVAGPADGRQIGPGLVDFLTRERVTVFGCVPTLLATMDRDVPSLRTLIVGGEECRPQLVERWSRPGRRILNTYGPTETTVTATWTELEPGKPVTIGRPLPGYQIDILDENLCPVAPGEAGEICIGGAGVAQGYLNRPELTADRFIRDPFGTRLYRSGDRGRLLTNGEIEFLGRMDRQVKVRGHRIELAEIEAVLLDDPAVENAVVIPAQNLAQDLIAYVTLRIPSSAVRDRLAGQLRLRLPSYMVPAFLEVLATMPTLASGKIDTKGLPPPASPRLIASQAEFIPPATLLEKKLRSEWQAILGHNHISVDADFFLDLGGHSLLAAQLVSRLRADPELAHLAIADLYASATIRKLARHLEELPSKTGSTTGTPVRPHSSARVWMAGALQLCLLYVLLGVLAAPIGFLLAAHGGGPSWAQIHPADLLVLPMLIALHFCLPVILKWTLVGRFRPGRYPLWGKYYCRWWLVRKALDLSPLSYLAGSPLMPLYLRLLGARIGKNCHIATAQVHLPDLIEIGEQVSIGYDAELAPFVVGNGWLEMAPIRIGAGAFIGTKSVLLAGAEVGRAARIAEQTLVSRDARIPEGESWAGSPARQVSTPDPVLEAIEAKPAPARKSTSLLWAAFAGAVILLEALPVLAALPGMLWIAWASRLHGSLDALAYTPLAGLTFVLATCATILFLKRLVLGRMRPGIYPVCSGAGFRKWVSDRLMATSLTVNNSLYATLYAVPWLRALGARIGRWSEVSTVSHIDPDLLRLGSETFVADIASIGAATFYKGYVSVERTEIGRRTFVGNASVVRSQANLPENCLIGVQSVVPEQPVEPGTSWLGSPAMFLPRREVCQGFDEKVTYRPRAALVALRLATELFRIVLPPSLLYLMAAVMGLVTCRLSGAGSSIAVIALLPALYLASAVMATLLVALLKWTIIGRYRPRVEPLWAPFVRRSELITGLYESVAVPALGNLLTGTPWIAPFLRLFGARIGRRVHLDTTFLSEFDLVQVEDDAAIARACSLQTHLFEDRVMKMSTVHVGAGCTIGPRSVVLYDSSLEPGASLDALSLVMKGESLPAETRWTGIPAQPSPRVFSLAESLIH